MCDNSSRPMDIASRLLPHCYQFLQEGTGTFGMIELKNLFNEKEKKAAGPSEDTVVTIKRSREEVRKPDFSAVGGDKIVAAGQFGEEIAWVLTRNATLMIGGRGAIEERWLVDFFRFSDLHSRKVIIEEGITEICGMLFIHCTELKEVILPGSLRKIGKKAFMGCTGLTHITLPENLEEIGDNAFYRCIGLKGIIIPDHVRRIGDWAFSECTTLRKVFLPSSFQYFGLKFFQDCPLLTTLILTPDSAAGKKYFRSGRRNIICCAQTLHRTYISHFGENILRVVLHGGYTEISSCTFQDASNLKEVLIYDTVQSIGDYAFKSCRSLEKLTLPESLTKIGREAFCDCQALKELNLPDTVESIGDYAFMFCTSLRQLTIPESVTEIGDGAFHSCKALKKLIIPDTVKNIGSNAFAFCDALEEVHMSDRLWHSCVSAFNYCSCPAVSVIEQGTLKHVFGKACDYRVPSEVTAIDSHAFAPAGWCLDTITVPDTVTRIDPEAFFGCRTLRALWLLEDFSDQDLNLFQLTGEQTSYEYQYGGKGRFRINGGYAFWYWNGELYAAWIGGERVNACFTQEIYSRKWRKVSHLIFPEGVTDISARAFENCGQLRSVQLPQSLKTIGDFAFAGCSSLTEINLPDSLTSIGAFQGCSSLKEIPLPNFLTSIGDRAFRRCDSLRTVTVPESVTHINNQAFSRCSGLENILIRSDLRYVGPGAFAKCSGLRTIRFEGAAPFFNFNAFDRTKAVVEYPAEGKDWVQSADYLKKIYGDQLTLRPY